MAQATRVCTAPIDHVVLSASLNAMIGALPSQYGITVKFKDEVKYKYVVFVGEGMLDKDAFEQVKAKLVA